MVYAASASLVDGFTRDHGRTAAAVARAAAMKSSDAAFFNEAVYQAAAQLESSANPSSRRVILWLTDNLPNVPTNFNLRNNADGLGGAVPHTEEEAIRRLHESGTTVMPLLLKDRLGAMWSELVVAGESPYRKKYLPGDAHKYAELTGGFAAGMRGTGSAGTPGPGHRQLTGPVYHWLPSDGRQSAGDVLPGERGARAGRSAASARMEGAGESRILPKVGAA